ncbi:MAG TPA: pyridoxamine 5'-phosphate oxidase [Bacteroidota bacterium]|nr:pyridoxamine 5'-phosphate oxidase [Bacteroidota bacterium]
MVTTQQQLSRGHRVLLESDLSPDPIVQFRLWFEEAVQAGIPDANAMTLATASRNGRVSARVVLLKSVDERGFCFYTNYESRKGRELQENPFAALVFFWQPLDRQVRVEGSVEKLSADESDEYFRSRPLLSRIGAHASPQSRVLPDRRTLDEAFKRLVEQFGNGDVPRPSTWGGYRVIPHSIEFWQGRENRLHDRLLYRRQETDCWIIERLAP